MSVEELPADRSMLAALVGRRRRFAAVPRRTGEDRQTGWLTLLLTEVTGDSGELLCDHCWLRPGDDTEALRPWVGRRVGFTAVVRGYARLDGGVSFSVAEIRDVAAKGRDRAMQRQRATPPAILAGHRHAEAFCLMRYRTADGTHIETLWNSRDGVTPFGITSVDGREMTHIQWEKDDYAPDYTPYPGQRVFADRTRESAERLAGERVERYWDHPDYPLSKMFATREEAVAAFARDFYGDGHEPAIVTVREDGTWEGQGG